MRLIKICALIFSIMSSVYALENNNLISIDDISKAEIEQILNVAHSFKATPQPDLLKGRILASCFFEPSTRTRLSFESAMYRLEGSVIGFTNGDTTSKKKGESLSDMMKGIGSFADVIVMRHPEVGSAHLAASVADVPVINGGDGFNQHPT